ncbi:MAG: rhomboid family intramembrane serine protease [Candidatus Micrarchaeota archaeon]
MSEVSKTLLAAIGICFIIQLIFPAFTDAFELNPYLALSEPWRLVTSIFLHDASGFMHIFFNAYALFMFGSILETQIRKREFLILFFGAGIIGSILYLLTTLGPAPPLCRDPVTGAVMLCSALGASGAIYGILGAVAVLLPDLKIFFWFFPMKIRYAAILWVALEFFGTFDSGSGVASAAHLGGLLFGLAYAWWLKNRRPVVRAAWEWQPAYE